MHIHILGICGTFMAGIARLALAQGAKVTGADKASYPPMSTELAALGIEVTSGYAAEDLPDADVFVIGNALSRGVPAIEAILNDGHPYCSGPEWLRQNVLPGRRVIAIAGTHGKTTTTALVAHCLQYAGHAPGWLLGGVAQDLPGSASLGRGREFVIEADEYDTAFFDKRSKFIHYQPHTLVINHLEYDHADIFPNLAAIQTQFQHVVRIVPSLGCIIHRANLPTIDEVLNQGCWTPRLSFAPEPGGDLHAELHRPDGTAFSIVKNGEVCANIDWDLRGEHNVANALAAFAVVDHHGVGGSDFARACRAFRGVKRRLEHRGRVAEADIYDDFAHHPTAIASTLAGVRASTPTRLIAVLELRSNSMRAGEYRETLAQALEAADLIWVLRPSALDWDLDAALAPLGPRVRVCVAVAALVQELRAALRRGDQVICMSNGDFQGLFTALLSDTTGD